MESSGPVPRTKIRILSLALGKKREEPYTENDLTSGFADYLHRRARVEQQRRHHCAFQQISLALEFLKRAEDPTLASEEHKAVMHNRSIQERELVTASGTQHWRMRENTINPESEKKHRQSKHFPSTKLERRPESPLLEVPYSSYLFCSDTKRCL